MILVPIVCLTALAAFVFGFSRYSIMISVKTKLSDEMHISKDEKQCFLSWFFFKKYKGIIPKIKIVWYFFGIVLYFAGLVALILVHVLNVPFYICFDIVKIYIVLNIIPLFLVCIERIKHERD